MFGKSVRTDYDSNVILDKPGLKFLITLSLATMI